MPHLISGSAPAPTSQYRDDNVNHAAPPDYDQLPTYDELVFPEDAHMVELPVVDDREFEMLE
jgi:hypothetical protein